MSRGTRAQTLISAICRCVRTRRRVAAQAIATRANRPDLKAILDTTGYLSNKSDIAALLVLSTSAYVQNMITRANYKVRNIMSARGR